MKQEDRLQAECYQWFHNRYPHLRGLLCYNFSNSRNIIEGTKNKSMGLQKGRADLSFYWQKKVIFIEMKILGEKQSASQIEWQKTIEAQGFDYILITSLEVFQDFFKTMLNG